MMKLLFLTSHVRHDQAGAAKALYALANHACGSGKAMVTMACDGIEDGVLHERIRVLSLPEPSKLPVLWRIHGFLRPYRLAAAIRVRDLVTPDFVYTASVDHAVAHARVHPKIPVILHAGATISSREILTEGDASLATRLDALAEDRSVRMALARKNVVHVVSTSLVAHERAEFYGVDPNRFDVSPYGVDERRFAFGTGDPDMRAKLGIPADAFVACTAARLVKWKRLDMFLEAAAIANSRPWVLIVGDGPERASLETLAQTLGIGERVRFVGFGDPSGYLGASDVFVLPSEIESFGLAYAEAMTMGLPCIGRRYRPPHVISSARDVIPEEAGFLIDDATELAARLDLMSGDRDRCRAMGAAARHHAQTHYTTAAYFDRITAFYRQRCELTQSSRID